ncbi:peptidase M48 Ste24p [Kibdelosporangium aridum]|uniref:Peptidase M48 Ste24p n=1 Tax=Kibdelosporangium aridum TaxID=2030 RepID=A0A428Z7C9_KIBAR|nr:M48 family metallopeptidase [Kibdelosporangium aridum]RSM83554.1 peptidase M48 Ste24p [Kibdelosporangium aridum]
MSVTFRAWLAVLALVGYFVLLGALVGACLWMIFEQKGALAIVFGGAVLLSALLSIDPAAARRARYRAHGAYVTRTSQPELWRVVDELAEAARTRTPDEIVIVAEANAMVWEETRLLGLRQGFRHLAIGLPLLAGLSVNELRAVIGHELGHFSHGHTKMAALTYRATMAMRTTAEDTSGSPVGWLFRGYSRLYLMFAGSVNRAQELEADAAAVRAAGKTATQSGFRKIPALVKAWQDYTETYFELLPYADRTPALLEGFRDYLADPVRAEEFVLDQARLLDAQPRSRFDSHPPMRDRLEAVDQLDVDDHPVDDRPATALLADPEKTVPRLEIALVPDDLGPRASWAEIVEIAGASVAAEKAAILGVHSGPPADAINAVSADHDRDTLVDLVENAMVHVLVRDGLAKHELNWSGPWRVRMINGELFDVTELVAEVVDDPAELPEARQWFTGLVASLQASRVMSTVTSNAVASPPE